MPMFKKQGQNSIVRKDKIRIPVFDKIWAEFQCYEGYGQTSNIYKNRGRISM